MPYNESTKKSILKWRENNKEKYLEYMRGITLNYYYQHRDERNKRRKQLHQYANEVKRMRNILIDDL